MLQGVAGCCRVLQGVAVQMSPRQSAIPVRRSVLHFVAVCCSVLQRVSACCSVFFVTVFNKVDVVHYTNHLDGGLSDEGCDV